MAATLKAGVAAQAPTWGGAEALDPKEARPETVGRAVPVAYHLPAVVDPTRTKSPIPATAAALVRLLCREALLAMADGPVPQMAVQEPRAGTQTRSEVVVLVALHRVARTADRLAKEVKEARAEKAATCPFQ